MLLLLAITAATATLTLGLALNGVTASPYLRTKAATNGPDVVAFLSSPQAGALVTAPGVAAHSGPYPVASATLGVPGLAVPVQAEGRDETLPAALAGIPLGVGLFAVANSGGVVSVPPSSWLAAAVAGALAAVAALTAVPASLGARQPAAPILQAGAA